jgi:hypothetical protein
MCTLTLISQRGKGTDAFRLVASRDEQRSRPAALPARITTHEGRAAWWPVDAQAGGTWIGVNDLGIVLGLLNVGGPAVRHAAQHAHRLSRGLIIPALLGSPSLEAAAERARRLSPGDYPPFRLVITDGYAIFEQRSDGVAFDAPDPAPWRTEPRLWTSSSLGDQLVQGPRRDLFDRTVGAEGTAASQDAFHRTLWPECAHLSPMMERADARTVSLTTIEVTRSQPPRVRCIEEPVPRSPSLLPSEILLPTCVTPPQ